VVVSPNARGQNLYRHAVLLAACGGKANSVSSILFPPFFVFNPSFVRSQVLRHDYPSMLTNLVIAGVLQGITTAGRVAEDIQGDRRHQLERQARRGATTAPAPCCECEKPRNGLQHFFVIIDCRFQDRRAKAHLDVLHDLLLVPRTNEDVLEERVVHADRAATQATRGG
jgi:hypothetical protein